MKKIKILVSIIILSSSQVLICQQKANANEEEAFLQQIESSNNSLPLITNLDFQNIAKIQQTGNNNYVSIDQTLIGTNIPANIAELIQNGDVNNAILFQNGSGNSHFINQTGNGNMLEASVIGDNNSSTIDQFGNNNIINQDLVGNDMAFILSQIGSGNEINQVEIDYNPRQYQVQQLGNGMKIMIINGGVIP
jgi:minor curlin subunit